MEKEKLLKELEYVNDILKDLDKNDGDRSFYSFQKSELEREIKECEENDRKIELQASN